MMSSGLLPTRSAAQLLTSERDFTISLRQLLSTEQQKQPGIQPEHSFPGPIAIRHQ